MKATTKKFTLLGTIALASVVALSLGVSGIFASAASDGTVSGRYYTDFSSKDDAFAAAEETNVALAEDGIVMLKNDGTLPLKKGAKVSVLGISQDCLAETSGTVTDSLKEAGFRVNPTLEAKYLADSSSTFGTESELNAVEKTSLGAYDDAAIVVISRGGTGESTGASSINIGETDEETYLGEDQGWAHEDSGHDNKHSLQLTDSEQELIELAETYCKKVIVLYSAPNTFEMANLQEDPNINGIYWIGHLGDGGIKALGEILSGEVSPSGGVTDEWIRDFTNDPTYANYTKTAYTDSTGSKITITRSEDSGILVSLGNNSATGLDYEEDIYLGYKFYETYWAEANGNSTTAQPTIWDGEENDSATADEWYDYNVVYPFGYGLSYTSFSYNLEGVYTNENKTSELSDATDLATAFASSVGSPAAIETLYADIEVTNTGLVAGKEIVQAYVEAPYYIGQTEKAYLNLVGYAKTDTLLPGQSQTVTVEIQVQDMASYDYTDANGDGHMGYELDQGAYTLHFMESSSHENIPGEDEENPAYAAESFTIGNTDVTPSAENAAVAIDLDDFSGNEVGNLFSGDGEESWSSDFDSMSAGKDSGTLTLLTRSDFDGTMPKAPESTALSDEFIPLLLKYEYIDADGYDVSGKWNGVDAWDDTGMPWEVTDISLLSGWTQGTGVIDETTGMYALTLDDMSDVDIDDPLWTTFMNQFTWDEIIALQSEGRHLTAAIPSIGKAQSADENGPNNSNSKFIWVGEPTVAATFNDELGFEYGRMAGNLLLFDGVSGWYGPGVNIHRNQFGGRCGEYYSQDGYLSGMMGAAVTAGAQSKGINVYVKHFAFYDTGSLFISSYMQISEQNMRENYLNAFQKCMQEGGAQACMIAVVCIGNVSCSQNYALLQQLARDEWGWTGFYVTDMASTLPGVTADGLVRCGGDIPDGGTGTNTLYLSGTWNGDYDWTTDATYGTAADDLAESAPQGAVMVGSTPYASLTQWYTARMSSQRILYNESHSAGNLNGITETSVNLTIDINQGASVNQAVLSDSIYGEAAGHIITASEITSGSLPAGLTLSGNTLSGAVTGTDGGSATLTVYVDGWVQISVNLTINVTPMVSLENDLSSLTTGTTVDTAVLLTGVPSGYTTSVTGGALPDGLTLSSDGLITGTVQKAGTYSFTITVTNGSSVYTLDYTIVVTGDDVTSSARGISSMTINASGELVVTYTDGTTQNLGTVVGTDGKDGADATANGVASVTQDGTQLVITYADGTTSRIDMNVTVDEEGNVVVGVASMEINAAGELVVYYTDGTSQNLGTVVGADGADGKDGADGSGCGSAMSLAGTAIALAFVLAAAGVVYAIVRKSRKNSADEQ